MPAAPATPLAAALHAAAADDAGGGGGFALALERAGVAVATDAAAVPAPLLQALSRTTRSAPQPAVDDAPATAPAPRDGDGSAAPGAPADLAALVAALLGQPQSAPRAQAAVASAAAVPDAARPALPAAATESRPRAPELAVDAKPASERPLPSSSTPAQEPVFVLPQPALPLPHQAPAAAAAEAPAPYAAQIQAPVGSPDFAPALSAQVSLLVRDGVTEARLELHPAEMGPITVQIAVDGAAAQVNFAAELADTRQVLSDALPELAATLRDSGLTLTGGGVFEQPRQPRGQADAHDRRGDAAPRDDTAPGVAGAAGIAGIAVPRRAAAARGVVDLYA